jgi:uncharacterized integral membrane protein (TIGR00698 family)
MSSVVIQDTTVRSTEVLRKLAPGIALTAAIACIAYWASHSISPFKNYQMIIAIMLGALVQNVIGSRPATVEGISFSLRRILRISIVLLGLQITGQQAAEVGVAGVAMIGAGLLATLVFTMAMGAILGVPRGLSLLIGVGTAICGASAVMAAKAAVHGKDDDAAYAIACVTLFGTIAIFAYPLAKGFLHLGPHDFGLWAGASIHEVAQVMATAYDGGPDALRIGAIAKLTRVAMMAPVIIGLGEISRHIRLGGDGERLRPPFPWFLVGFLCMVGVASFVATPHDNGSSIDSIALWVRENQASISTATAFLLSMAMAAMGLHTDLHRIRSRGLRPLTLGLCASLFISVAVLAMTRWIA